jgi:hypothetical protein
MLRLYESIYESHAHGDDDDVQCKAYLGRTPLKVSEEESERALLHRQQIGRSEGEQRWRGVFMEIHANEN